MAASALSELLYELNFILYVCIYSYATWGSLLRTCKIFRLAQLTPGCSATPLTVKKVQGSHGRQYAAPTEPGKQEEPSPSQWAFFAPFWGIELRLQAGDSSGRGTLKNRKSSVTKCARFVSNDMPLAHQMPCHPGSTRLTLKPVSLGYLSRIHYSHVFVISSVRAGVSFTFDRGILLCRRGIASCSILSYRGVLKPNWTSTWKVLTNWKKLNK